MSSGLHGRQLSGSLPWRSASAKPAIAGLSSNGPRDADAAAVAALHETLRKVGGAKKALGKHDSARALGALFDALPDALLHAAPLATAQGPAQRRGIVATVAAAAASSSAVSPPWARLFRKRMAAMQDLVAPETAARLLDTIRVFLSSLALSSAASTDDLPSLLHPSASAQQLTMSAAAPSLAQSQGNPRQSKSATMATHRALAESLADYLSTHVCDPDNSLLGLWVASSVVGSTGVVLQQQPQQPQPQQHRLAFGRSAEAATQLVQALPRLLDTVCGWATLPDAELCARARSFVEEIPSWLMLLRRGTLVAVRLPEDSKRRLPARTVYGRVAAGAMRADGAFVSVTIDPVEASAQEIPIGDVAIVPRALVQRPAAAAANPCQDVLEDVLVDAKDMLMHLVSRHAAERCPDLNYDIELTRRVLSGAVGLRDAEAVRAALESISVVLTDDAALTQFVNAANVPFVDKIPAMLERVSAGELPIFPLLRHTAVTELQNADILQIVRNMVLSSRDACQASVDKLHAELSDVRSGVRKKKVTEWYLALIRESVNDFLTAKGFDHSAVPQDYIETAPASIEAVQRNLAIVRGLLSSGRDSTTELGILTARVCGTIYPELDLLAENMRFVVAKELGLALDSPTFAVDAAAQIATLDAKDQRVKLCKDLLKDLDYLQTMHALETTTARANMDVVPVSGLIVGRFTRFENELQTVLGIWGPRFEAQRQQALKL